MAEQMTGRVTGHITGQQGTATVAGTGPGRDAAPGRGAEGTWAAEPVPHVVPLDMAGPDVAESLPDDELNQQITEAFSELIKHAQGLGHGIAAELGLTGSDAIALFKLEGPMTMKELGQRMGCDPSFITTIADALERHGLARREPSLRDRRSKNIVLTPEGVTVRDRICAELGTRAPWCTELDTGERRCLLGLMRKMLRSRGGR